MKTLDSGAGAMVFEQAGYVHELDPKTGKTHMVNITATGDFPVDDAALGRRDQPHDQLALSPTGKRVLVEARGEIFTIPAEKGDVRNLSQSSGSAERDPAWSPDGKCISYFSDKSGEYKVVVESQDGLTPPRAIALPQADPLLHAVLVARFEEAALHRHESESLGAGYRQRPGEDHRRRSVDGAVADASIRCGVPDSKWVAYASHLKSLYHAIFISNVETGETKQVTDGLADSVWPAWDASGKYLWFFASTDFGSEIAVAGHDVLRSRRKFRAVSRGA